MCAWVNPATVSTGDLVDAATWNQAVKANTEALRAGGLALSSQAAQDVLYASSATQLSRLAAGTSGHFLRTNGTGSAPSWASAATTFAGVSPLTTRGDVLVASSGTVTGDRLAVGASGTVLSSDGTDATWATSLAAHMAEGRLTLTSGTAVSADVTGAANIYYTPYHGDRISLYTGSAWAVFTLTELTLAISSVSASLPFDVFVDHNGGTLALVGVSWSSATARATALVLQDGVPCLTGDLERRWVGTAYADASNQCDDQAASRGVWNVPGSQVPRSLLRRDGTASWSYSSSTWRIAGGNASNIVSMISGASQPPLVTLTSISSANADTAWRRLAIGLDGTTPAGITGVTTVAASELGMATAIYADPILGWHNLQWLESVSASGTTTFYGATANQLSGFTGQIMA